MVLQGYKDQGTFDQISALVIDLGTWRRTLVLPRILVDAPTEGARFEDGTLKIRFGTPAREGAAR